VDEIQAWQRALSVVSSGGTVLVVTNKCNQILKQYFKTGKTQGRVIWRPPSLAGLRGPHPDLVLCDFDLHPDILQQLRQQVTQRYVENRIILMESWRTHTTPDKQESEV